MIGTPIETLTVTQIKEELRSLYGMKDLSDCLELKDLKDKLIHVRNTQPVTHGLRYGTLLEVGNTRSPTGVVTLSHGLGDSARGWEDVASEISRRLPYLLFLLPTAPMRSVTINGGMSMNAWYDITNTIGTSSPPRQEGEAVMASADYICSLAYTATQRYRIPNSRVVYAGFSQGAAVSLAAGITCRIPPAGVAALSGYLAGGNEVLSRLRNKNTPILMCHGTHDTIIPFEAARRTKEALEKDGVKSVQLNSYPMEHSSHPKEIEDVVKFLKQVLPPVSV